MSLGAASSGAAVMLLVGTGLLTRSLLHLTGLATRISGRPHAADPSFSPVSPISKSGEHHAFLALRREKRKNSSIANQSAFRCPGRAYASRTKGKTA